MTEELSSKEKESKWVGSKGHLTQATKRFGHARVRERKYQIVNGMTM